MSSPRHIKTPYFAAAIYACACLLVYGTVTGTHARQPAKMTGARQHASEKSTLRVNAAFDFPAVRFDFPAVRQAARKACVHQAMLSAALITRHRTAEVIRYQSTILVAPERQATVAFLIPGETSCALLSRWLADA